MASICKSCRAPIKWIQMAKSGKKNPLDVQPTPDGNVAIGGDGLGYIVNDMNRKPPLYKSHFATCPNAQQHKK